MNLIFAGDFFIEDTFINQQLIDSSVEELFTTADYRIINLETPITTNKPQNKILKTGPHLRSSTETILPYLKQLNIDMVTLANNHILDYGANGLIDTFKTLQKNEIDYTGAGTTLKEATKPFTIEKDGIKIAILNFAENEWSIAEKDKPGANPLDIIDNVKQIKAAKIAHDKVICIIHGGHEYYNLPSPRMVKQYRFYAENGADAIVGHHTHCISGYEVFNDVPIIYSLGNFLFTLQSKKEEWYSGLLLQLKLETKKPVSFELLPIQQNKETFKTTLLKNDERINIIDEVEVISNTITNETKLQQEWDSFINKNLKRSITRLSPTSSIRNRYLRAFINQLGVNKIFMNKNYLKLILNLMRCEAHSNKTISILEKYINSSK